MLSEDGVNGEAMTSRAVLKHLTRAMHEACRLDGKVEVTISVASSVFADAPSWGPEGFTQLVPGRWFREEADGSATVIVSEVSPCGCAYCAPWESGDREVLTVFFGPGSDEQYQYSEIAFNKPHKASYSGTHPNVAGRIVQRTPMRDHPLGEVCAYWASLEGPLSVLRDVSAGTKVRLLIDPLSYREAYYWVIALDRIIARTGASVRMTARQDPPIGGYRSFIMEGRILVYGFSDD